MGNRRDSKSISDIGVTYGVMSDSYIKNPRLLWYLAEMVQYIEYYVEGKNIRTTWLYSTTSFTGFENAALFSDVLFL